MTCLTPEFLNDVKDVKDHITTMRAIKGELNVYPLKVLMEKFRDRCPHYVVRLDGGGVSRFSSLLKPAP